MKIVVASAFEASSHKAHAINTTKIAEGFAKLGHEVHLVCLAPLKNKCSSAELNAMYGVHAPLHWHQLPSKVAGLRITPHWRFTLLALPVVWRLAPDFIYSRNYILPALTSRLGIPTVGETHAWPDNATAAFRAFLQATHHKAFRQCVTISHRLSEEYIRLGANPDKMRVLPDAVDLRMFEPPAALPEKNLYKEAGPHILYVGHLYDYKGIPTILETAALLPHRQFHLVGGLPADIQRQQRTIAEKGLTNVILHGLKPYAEVPPYLWQADILLLPPSAQHPSAAWTSPVKLAEYLASGVPVIATAIPALKDWLSDAEVCFVAPDDAPAMAEGIERILAQPEWARQLVQAASHKAHSFTYEGRAQAMLESNQVDAL